MRSFFFFILIFNFSCLLSQENAEIPLKDNKIYYVFKSSFKNEKLCLAKYSKSIREINEQTSKRVGEKLKGRYNKTYDPKDISSLLLMGWSKNCNDTLKDGIYQLLLPGGLKLIDFTLIGALTGSVNGRVMYSAIRAKANLYFPSDNEFELRLKGFTLELNYFDGTQTNVDLSELYLELMSKDKKSAKDLKLFNELDEILKLNVEALIESFNYVISTDELD